MTPNAPQSPTVAVIGAGLAGASCAASLHRAGLRVVLFDKSAGVGGRMATRHARWVDSQGAGRVAAFDHGAPDFAAQHPRFRAALARAEAAGSVARWSPRVHAAWPPTAAAAPRFVALPDMPALCRHVIGAVPLRLEHTVQRLARTADGWRLTLAASAGNRPVDAVGDAPARATPPGAASAGPFDHVMLALPAAQAALLLAGHHDAWADTLAAADTAPCWTLMAVTDDVDWPWDAAEPDRGPLRWVGRADRKPGRAGLAGCATWVAHALPEWSAAHLDDDPQAVAAALRDALAALLPGGVAVRGHHAVAHRWRYAAPVAPLAGGADCWWEPRLSLGVCGDFFGPGPGSIEAAWRSGDELADAVSAWLEAEQVAVSAMAAPAPAGAWA